MIELRWRTYDPKTHNPKISNAEIAKYAETLLARYMPHLLKEPGPINYMRFLEAVLGANVEIQDIYYEYKEPAIVGMTVFNKSRVKLFDKENMDIREIVCDSGTIILDNTMLEKRDESFARFTGLHEGGHFCLHPETYRRIRAQNNAESRCSGDAVICSKQSMTNTDGEGLYVHGIPWDAESCREHQANAFSASLAMPAKTFIPAARAMIRDLGCEDFLIIEEELKTQYYDEFRYQVKKLAGMYGMSFTATKNHLRTHGLLIPRAQYELMRICERVI